MKKLTFLILISLTIFACNKKDDPQPTSNNNGTTPPPTTTNTPPTVSATPSSATNPTTITINATDADGTISKVEIFNGSTLLTTLTTSPYIYTLPTLTDGSYTYTVKATDNSNAVSSTTVSFTVSVSNPKTDTETILNAFMNKSLSDEGSGDGSFFGTLTITSTTMTASQTQPPNQLFGGAIASSSYTVDSDGHVIMNNITYSVSTMTNNTILVLTKLTGSGQVYTFQNNTTPKDATTALLSGFTGRTLTISFNSTLQYEGTTLTINSNGTLSSNSTESMFYGDNANVASGRYVINDDGTIAVRPPAANIATIYTVSKPNSTTLRLTLDNGDYFEFN
jgi:hypothetical protein